MSTLSTKVLVGTIVLAAVALGVFYAFLNFSDPARIVGTIREPLQQGQYDIALSEATKAIEAATSEDTKALARIEAAMLPFAVSGDINDAIEEVKTMADIAKNPSISTPVRASAMTSIESIYRQTGESKRVFEAIFAEGAFKEHLVTVPSSGSVRRHASLIRLYMASFDLAPSALSAIYAASHSLTDVYKRPGLDKEIKEARIKDAERYLAAADAFHELFLKNETYRNTFPYTVYLHERAYVLAGLASFDRVPASQYREAFETALAHVEGSDIAFNVDRIPFIRYDYAVHLLKVEEDKAGATKQFDALLAHLESRTRDTNFGGVLASIDLGKDTLEARRLKLAMDSHEGFKLYVENAKENAGRPE